MIPLFTLSGSGRAFEMQTMIHEAMKCSAIVAFRPSFPSRVTRGSGNYSAASKTPESHMG